MEQFAESPATGVPATEILDIVISAGGVGGCEGFEATDGTITRDESVPPHCRVERVITVSVPRNTSVSMEPTSTGSLSVAGVELFNRRCNDVHGEVLDVIVHFNNHPAVRVVIDFDD